MSVQTKLKERELRDKRAMHDEQMEVEREKSKRSAAANVIGGVASGIAKGFGGALLKNHPIWYKKFGNSELFANIPTWMSKASATRGMTECTVGSSEGRALSSTRYMASVFCHEFAPVLAYTKEASLTRDKYPINETMKIVLTEIGKVNSRAVNPDNSIPGLYFLASTEIAACLSEIKFIIDVIDQFVDNDPNVPRSLVMAKGWDYDFILTNIADLRKLYNIYALKFNKSLPLPKDFDLVNRRVWLNSVIIKDSDSPKPIYQMFKQIAFASITGAYSIGTWFNSTLASNRDVRGACQSVGGFGPLQYWLEQAFSGILDDEDYCTFIANLRAASSGNGFYVLPEVGVKSIIINSIDDDVRQQMMNIVTLCSDFATGMRGPTTRGLINLCQVDFDDDGNLYQDYDNHSTNGRGYLIRVSDTTMRDNIINHSHVLQNVIGNFNSFKSEIKPDDILTMTRLHPEYNADFITVTVSGTTYYDVYADYVSRGTEVVISSKLWYYDKDEAEVLSEAYTNLLRDEGYSPAANSLGVFAVDGLYNILCPMFQPRNEEYMFASTMQWDNCFVIPQKNLSELHRLCSRSLYYCDPGQFKKAYSR